MVSGDAFLFGVIRPGWDVEGGANAFHRDGHCFYDTLTGYHYPGRNPLRPFRGRNWEGTQDVYPLEEGARVGLLLDLDQGSMTVYKNDERLGVMATGLSGEYCWAAELRENPYWAPAPGAQGSIISNSSVRIEAAVAPVSPTAEELTRAVAYEAEISRRSQLSAAI